MTRTPHGSSRIGIIGNGNVGTALSEGLQRAGYEVRSTGRDPETVRDVAEWSDLVVLAVPYSQRRAALSSVGKENLAEKTLVDVTNPLAQDYGFAGSLKRSGAEELQKWVGSECCVVKAFNTTFANTMSTGQVQEEPITLFCAGDDVHAKQEVYKLGRDIGFDPVDAGPLANARWLETLGYFNIQLGYKVGLGAQTGFRYLHPGMARHVPRPDAKVRGRTERRRAGGRAGAARTRRRAPSGAGKGAKAGKAGTRAAGST